MTAQNQFIYIGLAIFKPKNGLSSTPGLGQNYIFTLFPFLLTFIDCSDSINSFCQHLPPEKIINTWDDKFVQGTKNNQCGENCTGMRAMPVGKLSKTGKIKESYQNIYGQISKNVENPKVLIFSLSLI